MNRRAIRRFVPLIALTLVPLLPLAAKTGASSASASAPTSPPAPMCNSLSLAGPLQPPPGAVVVQPGDNSGVNFTLPGTTYWFAAGVHTFGPSLFGQVVAANNATYVGAPGAILDGMHVNHEAFGSAATGVTVENLTIRNFGVAGGGQSEGVVNHDAGTGWTIQYNTITGNAGAGVMLGDSTLVRFNCLSGNGQYGYSAFKPAGVHNVTLDRNEISFNNTDDWETRSPGCGCSGAGKFWNVTGAVLTGNWVHDNHSFGIFVDTDNAGIQIEGNYIENNDNEGIVYETSYNGRIASNTLRRNAIVKGHTFAAAGNSFPVGAIYVTESGGDPRVANGTYSTFEITGNNLVDNWGGVILFESANRFCGANGGNLNCTLGGLATPVICAAGTILAAPYLSDCRWKTQNVSVHDNDLSVDYNAIGCAASAFCAQEGLLSDNGTSPPWSPYLGPGVKNAVTFSQNNHFANNHYNGDWRFVVFQSGTIKSLSGFQAAPYQQDLGSTQTGKTPPPVSGAVDLDTATLEGSMGHWQPWFSTNISRSSAQAHLGSNSLRVDVTAPFGWGVNLNNDPGFPATAGLKNVSFWGMAPSPQTGLAANLTVKWRDSNGADLQTDTVAIGALGPTWAQGSASLLAPLATAYVSISLSSTTATAGNTMYFDDFAVTDAITTPPPTTTPPTTTPPTTTLPTTAALPPLPAAGALDSDTATLEGSIGHWQPWFSDNISRSSAQAHSGANSLRVDVTAPFGWGVQLNNDPGFPTTPGLKTVSYWGLAPAPQTGLAANLTVKWRNAAGADLLTNTITIGALGPTWAQGSTSISAPVGTAYVSVSLSSSTATAGNTMYFDDFAVANAVTTPPPTTTPPTTTPPTPPTTAPPPPRPASALDADTATLAGSIGRWQPWFSDTISRSLAQGHAGGNSLRVDVTAPYGWGVQLNNDPGFPTSAGPKTVSFWGMAPAPQIGLAANLTVKWRNAAGADIQTTIVSIGLLSPLWAQGTLSVFAPLGTAYVSISVSSSTGTAGNTMYFDDFFVSP